VHSLSLSLWFLVSLSFLVTGFPASSYCGPQQQLPKSPAYITTSDTNSPDWPEPLESDLGWGLFLAQLLFYVLSWSWHLPVWPETISDIHGYQWSFLTNRAVSKEEALVDWAETSECVFYDTQRLEIFGLLTSNPWTPVEALAIIMVDMHSLIID
jgi:hypothetical protein